MKIIKIYLKWVHMARYELILRLEGALWLTIISKPLLTPRRAIKNPKLTNKLVFFSRGGHHQAMVAIVGALANDSIAQLGGYTQPGAHVVTVAARMFSSSAYDIVI